MTVVPDVFGARVARARQAMADHGVDALLLSLGADLPWLTGYTAMPLERLTMLVVPAASGAQPVLVVPQLEAPRVVEVPGVFAVQPWGEAQDPVAMVAGLVAGCVGGASPVLAISDRAWATFLLQFQARFPGAAWRPASTVTSELRAVKDTWEVEALAAAAASADRVSHALLQGEIELVGRTERQVSAEISRRLLEEGHDRVNFAIVASGPNGASPHHDASDRTIERGDAIVCDFGGSMAGYCSDTTRTVFTGPPPAQLADVYEAVRAAQEAGTRAAVLGAPCAEVDRAARGVIAQAGFGEYFVHRTGHGIGLEEHEDPYMVEGNTTPLAVGHAFSVEPGIYIPGRYGVRIEDIVVATPAGPRSLNQADRGLTVVA
jgi:Xaa-Pro aminopeptidase